MHRAPRVLLVIAVMLAAASARAQGPTRLPAAATPYQPVAAKLPPLPDDPSFATFRKDFAAIARGRVFERLAHYVVAHGFFWDRDFGKGFDPKKSGVENLATAIGLERGAGNGWQALAAFADEPSASEIPAAPGVLCAPARPIFDSEDFDRLADATRSAASEWVISRTDGLGVHAAPRAESAVVEQLGLNFVRVVRFETAAANADPIRTAWARVAAPSGKVGYVAPDTLMALSPARLCYIKDVTGRWQITGYIGGPG